MEKSLQLEKAWQLVAIPRGGSAEAPSASSPSAALKTGEIQWFDWQVEDGWQQGRGAYGGLVIGVMVRAAELAVNDASRAVRSVSAELCGPVVVGVARVGVELLRSGSGMTTVAVRVVQLETGTDGQSQMAVQAHAVVILGKVRVKDSAWNELTPPLATHWTDTVALPSLPMMPAFANQFEYRPFGDPPYAEAEQAQAIAWIQPRENMSQSSAAWVVAMSDVVWPSMMVRFAGPRPMATVSYLLEIVADWADLDPNRPLLHVGRTPVSQNGYTVEFRELWSDSGELVALNQQTIVIIK